MSVASTAAFNFFHIRPTGRFIAAAVVADLARARATEAELRRREADLGADLARL
jgi:hypothetical protein